MVHYGVYKGSIGITRCRMDYHTLGLIYYKEVIILIDYVQVNILG